MTLLKELTILSPSIIKQLSELSPSIILYPVEKVIKAFVNLALDRKIASSIGRIIATGIGIGIAIHFPQISQVGALIAYLVLDANISSATALTLSTITSAWLCASCCIYLMKSAFQTYYFHKYGVTNPEHRFTEKDELFIRRNNLNKSDEELDNFIFEIKQKINQVVIKLSRLKEDENRNEHEIQHIKSVLYKLKKGDLDFFNDFYDIESLNKYKP